MKIGKCVDSDYGYLGCRNDALQILDSRCSGKKHCSFPINNDLRVDGTHSCAKPLTGYANIEYRCQEGVKLFFTKSMGVQGIHLFIAAYF